MASRISASSTQQSSTPEFSTPPSSPPLPTHPSQSLPPKVSESKNSASQSGMQIPETKQSKHKPASAELPFCLAYPSHVREITQLPPSDHLKRILDICRDFGLAGMIKELSTGRKKRLDTVLWPTPNISKNTSPKQAVEYERMAKLKSIGAMHQGMQPARAYITGSAARMISIDKKASPSDHDVTFELENYNEFAKAFAQHFGEPFPDMDDPFRSKNFVFSSQEIPGGLHIVIDRRGCHKKVDLVIRFTDQRDKWTTTYSDLTSSCRVYFGKGIEPYYQVPIPSGTIRLLREANIMHHPDDIEKLLLRMFLARDKYKSFLIAPGQVQRHLEKIPTNKERVEQYFLKWGWTDVFDAYRDADDDDKVQQLINQQFPLLPPEKLLELWQKEASGDADLVFRLLLLDLTQFEADHAKDPAHREAFKAILTRECQEVLPPPKEAPPPPPTVEVQPKVFKPELQQVPQEKLPVSQVKPQAQQGAKKLPRPKRAKKSKKTLTKPDEKKPIDWKEFEVSESKREVPAEPTKQQLQYDAVRAFNVGNNALRAIQSTQFASRQSQFSKENRAKVLAALDTLLDAVDKLRQAAQTPGENADLITQKFIDVDDVWRCVSMVFPRVPESSNGSENPLEGVKSLAIASLCPRLAIPTIEELRRVLRLQQCLQEADLGNRTLWMIGDYYAHLVRTRKGKQHPSVLKLASEISSSVDACLLQLSERERTFITKQCLSVSIHIGVVDFTHAANLQSFLQEKYSLSSSRSEELLQALPIGLQGDVKLPIETLSPAKASNKELQIAATTALSEFLPNVTKIAQAVRADDKQFEAMRHQMLEAMDKLLAAVEKLDAATGPGHKEVQQTKREALNHLNGVFVGLKEDDPKQDPKNQELITSLAIAALCPVNAYPSSKELERVWKVYQYLQWVDLQNFLKGPLWLVADYLVYAYGKRVTESKQKPNAKSLNTTSILSRAVVSELDSIERVKIVGKLINEVFSKTDLFHAEEFRKFLTEYEGRYLRRKSAAELADAGIAEHPTGKKHYQRAVAAMGKLAKVTGDPKPTVFGILDDLIRAHTAYHADKELTLLGNTSPALLLITKRLAWMVDEVPLYVVPFTLKQHRNFRRLVLGLLAPSGAPTIAEISRVLNLYKILKKHAGYKVHEWSLHLLATYYVRLNPKSDGPLKDLFAQRMQELRTLVQPALSPMKGCALAMPLIKMLQETLKEAPGEVRFQPFIEFLETEYPEDALPLSSAAIETPVESPLPLHGLAVKSLEEGVLRINSLAQVVLADRKQLIVKAKNQEMLKALDLLLDAVEKFEQVQRSGIEDAKIPAEPNKYDALCWLHGIFSPPNDDVRDWGDSKTQQAIRDLAVATFVVNDADPTLEELERILKMYRFLRITDLREFLELPFWLFADYYAKKNSDQFMLSSERFDKCPSVRARNAQGDAILTTIIHELDAKERVDIVDKLVQEIFSGIGAPVPARFAKFIKTYDDWMLSRTLGLEPSKAAIRLAPWEQHYERAVAAMSTLNKPSYPRAKLLSVLDDLLQAYAQHPKKPFPVQIGIRIAWLVDQVPLSVAKLTLKEQQNLRGLVLGLLCPGEPPMIHEIRRIINMYKILQELPGYPDHDSPLRLLAMYCLQLESLILPGLKGVFDPLWAELRVLMQPELGLEETRWVAQQILAGLENVLVENCSKGFKQFLATLA
jgi:hypothetical protein